HARTSACDGRDSRTLPSARLPHCLAKAPRPGLGRRAGRTFFATRGDLAMKKLLLVSIVSLMTCMTFVRPAAAFPVIDIANLIQNTLAALQQIEQISNQIQQVRNQA